jgi:uncharacterized protein (DUF1800 family)
MRMRFTLPRGSAASLRIVATVAPLVWGMAVGATQGTAQRPAHQTRPAAKTTLATPATPAATLAADDPEQTLLDADDARFFLSRVGFAPDNVELAPYLGLTREQAVDKVLATTRTEALTPMPAWVHETIPTRDERKVWTSEQRRVEQHQRSQRYEELRAWWVREMATTPSPLTERMTLFWHNHFTSGQDKVAYPQLMAQQNLLFRREALGNFGELLHAAAKDPAMLQYLDGAGNRKGKPNENFAREVMELFTLGEGRYSQRDVSEAARAYTGWSLDPDTLAYVWQAGQHDDGVKTVFGESGTFDGDQVLDLLLARPETATFVITRLWREFISETPDPAQIAPIATRFRASHYDIKVALRELFLSDAFWDEANRGTLVKSPAEFVVGTLREFDIGYDSTTPFAREMRTLGENLFYPPNVKGWPGGEIWINSSTLLARKQFVEQLFRATEAASPRHPQPPSMSGNPQDAAMLRRAMAQAGQGGVRFDIGAWLAQYHAAPTTQAGLSAELQLQHAVLPLAPVDAIATDSTGSAYLEALLMDPAFQLK